MEWREYFPRLLKPQLILAMKLTGIFILFFCFQLQATGFSQRITLSEKNAGLETIFTKIFQQTGYEFFYNSAQIKEATAVSIEVENQTLLEVLVICFKNQPLEYEVHDRTVIVRRKTDLPVLISITGIITSENDEPIEGATIRVKNSGVGTITGTKGEFTLNNIQENATLIISSIGFDHQEVNLDGKISVKIKLKIAVKGLDETIIKGYYNTSRRLNTGSVEKISANEISKQPGNNIAAALEGRVPGLYIEQATGVPGGGIKIQIRGINSISNGNAPLYLVDGVPVSSVALSSYNVAGNITGGANPLSNLNPAIIESIEILKDADATAIYGSRGANGVILITTKKGRIGKTTATINFYQGIGKVTRKFKLLNTEEYLEMRNEAFSNDGVLPTTSDYDVNGTWDNTRNTDWQKVLIGGSANITDVNASVTGGNELTQFAISGGYHYESTVFPGNYGYKKPNALVSLNHATADKRVKLSFLVNYGVEDNRLMNYDVTLPSLVLPPNAPAILNADNELNWENGTFRNPFSYVQRPYYGITRNLISSAQFGVVIAKNFEGSVRLGYSKQDASDKALNPLSALNPYNGFTSGYSIVSSNSLQSWIVEPQVKYRASHKKSRVDVIVGSTFQKSGNDLQTLYLTGFTSDALLTNIAAASDIFVITADDSKYAYAAAFGRLGYNFNDKLIVNATGRRDGSSRFGPGKRFANFGAAGIAYIFSKEEPVQKLLPFLSFGKLHFSYGTTGNDQIGNYNYLDTYGPTGRNYQGQTGLYPLRLFNSEYSWEKNQKLETGLDIGLFNDRILTAVTAYWNKSSNLLLGYPLAPTTGFFSVTKNLPATVVNSGVEVSVKADIIKSTTFNWNASFNLSFPRNELTSFENLDRSPFAETYEIGKPLTVVKAFEVNPVDAGTGLYTFNTLKDSLTNYPIYPDDLSSKYSVTQSYYGGLQNTFTYKNWELDIFFHFVKQMGRNYLYAGLFNMPGTFGNQPALTLDRWQKPGDNALVQRYSQDYGGAPYNAFANAVYTGDISVADASFIRLRNLSLSYDLPTSTFKKLLAQSLKLYVRCQNLFVITNYQGLDPENNALPGALPPLRYLTAGFQLTF